MIRTLYAMAIGMSLMGVPLPIHHGPVGLLTAAFHQSHAEYVSPWDGRPVSRAAMRYVL